MRRYLLAALLLVLEAPFLIVLLLGTMVSAPLRRRWSGTQPMTPGRDSLRRQLSVLRPVLAFERRARLIVVQLIVAVGVTAYVLARVTVGEQFAREQSGFFQTASQVEVGVLVALALTRYAMDDPRELRAVQFSVQVAVLLGALALAAGLAGTTPSLPTSALRWVFAIAVGGVASSLIGLVMISRRLLDL